MKPVHLLKRLCWSMALAVLLAAAAASVATAAPVLQVNVWKPDYVTPGRFLVIWANVVDVGDRALTGNLTLRYTFPTGISVSDPTPSPDSSPSATCTPSGQVNECVADVTGFPVGRDLIYQVLTSVDPSATGTLTGQLEISGGGASNSVTVPLAFNTDPIGPFDVKSFDVAMTDNPAVQPAQAG